MEYSIIRSNRKTLAIEIRGTDVIVRAPISCGQRIIADFVSSHEDWINKKIAEAKERNKVLGDVDFLTADELRELGKKACEYIPGRVALYAEKIGVTYGNITIRCQRTKWGSCSGKGNLNFNCLLMLAPPEVIDSIVVHELCHRKEMNHSGKFYEEVYKVFPEYDKWHGWLKENGPALMARWHR